MTPERWQKIEEIYDVLPDCEPQRREELLSQLCLDDQELEREVQFRISNVPGLNCQQPSPAVQARVAA